MVKLDCWMRCYLNRVKFELNLLPVHTPAALDEVKPQIVRLIDALLHVQQINSETQLEVREKILRRVFNCARVGAVCGNFR